MERPPAPQVDNRSGRMTIILAVVGALGGLVLGLDSGAIAGALLFLKQAFHVTVFQREWMASALLVGAMGGSLLAGRLADAIGRRLTLAGASLLAAAFAVATSQAPNFATMLGARLLSGFAVGVLVVVGPMFTAEFAPPRLRGRMNAGFQLAVAIGLELAYWGNFVFGRHDAWRDMFLLTAAPALLLLSCALLLPDTPRWYFLQGRLDEGERALALVAPSASAVAAEAQRIREEIEATRPAVPSVSQSLWQPGLRRALLLGVGFAVIEQLTGIKTVTYYGPTIFVHAGFTRSSALFVTAVVGGITVAATIAGMTLIDRWGRRPLILTSLSGMAISMALLGTAFALGRSDASLGPVTVGSVMLFHVAYSLGIGLMGWVLLPEIYPNRVRAKAQSLTKVVNWAAGLTVSLGFLSVTRALGPSGTFFLFAAIVVAGLIFCYGLVPETKGYALEAIDHLWEKPVSPTSSPEGL